MVYLHDYYIATHLHKNINIIFTCYYCIIHPLINQVASVWIFSIFIQIQTLKFFGFKINLNNCNNNLVGTFWCYLEGHIIQDI